MRHADPAGTHLRGEPQPLQLAGRQRRHAPFQAQIALPRIKQHRLPGRQVGRDALGDDG